MPLKKLSGTIIKLVTVLIWSNLSVYNPTIIPNDPMNKPPKDKYMNHKKRFCIDKSINKINNKVDTEAINKPLAAEANVIAKTISEDVNGL